MNFEVGCISKSVLVIRQMSGMIKCLGKPTFNVGIFTDSSIERRNEAKSVRCVKILDLNVGVALSKHLTFSSADNRHLSDHENTKRFEPEACDRIRVRYGSCGHK